MPSSKGYALGNDAKWLEQIMREPYVLSPALTAQSSRWERHPFTFCCLERRASCSTARCCLAAPPMRPPPDPPLGCRQVRSLLQVRASPLQEWANPISHTHRMADVEAAAVGATDGEAIAMVGTSVGVVGAAVGMVGATFGEVVGGAAGMVGSTVRSSQPVY